ncbi:SPOSA6832_04924 [Sporobolomyces salmonicolor]|uniref:SPOSA6832_04924-mRNA-1:cds n=1 Tax=Sporidiobolus salmonicolor TaxID=5005 RepID=A0A0D6ESU3_SPOSA|nr:SPOSA6832_04924 [Sporobolomyces salmonicolor]
MLRLSSSFRSRLRFARSLTTAVPHTAEAASHIRTVGVVGAGQMGLGIGYVAARLSKGLAFADALLEKEVKKGKLNKDEAVAVRGRLKVVKGIEQFGESGVDLAIEAASESLPVKQQIFSALATHLPPSAILASNTSSISLSKLAASAISSTTGENRAQSVVGFHFCPSSISRTSSEAKKGDG